MTIYGKPCKRVLRDYKRIALWRHPGDLDRHNLDMGFVVLVLLWALCDSSVFTHPVYFLFSAVALVNTVHVNGFWIALLFPHSQFPA